VSATLIAIGDELLGGFVLDTNSHWIAGRLRALGHPLKRISVVGDRPAEIVEQVRRDLADAEVTDVFTSGGLGPTPDDRTFEALAAALGRELVEWPEVRERIAARVGRMHAAGLLESPELTEGNLRMARIPAGPIHVFRNRKGMAPGAVYEAGGKRLFVLPGVPLEMKAIFTEELETEFLAGGTAAAVREVRFRFAVEALIYPVMRELEQSHPDVAVGSYPNFETKELTIRCSGADARRVEAVARIVRERATALGFTPL
jgi:molybdenum cofactor synthesis domain-containing protein